MLMVHSGIALVVQLLCFGWSGLVVCMVEVACLESPCSRSMAHVPGPARVLGSENNINYYNIRDHVGTESTKVWITQK